MIRITLSFATACSVAMALPMSLHRNIELGLPMSASYGVASELPMSDRDAIASRQPFRPNRIEPLPNEETPTGDAGIPTMRLQEFKRDDDSVEKEARLHFADVLKNIENLPMVEEAQSGVEDISKEKLADPRSLTTSLAKRLDAVSVKLDSTAPAKPSTPEASPSKDVLEGENNAADSKPTDGEGQEKLCAITLEMLADLPFEKFIPVAKHLDKHGHFDGVAGEVIIGEAIIPVAGAIGVVPCKELQNKLQNMHQHIHHHKSDDRQLEIVFRQWQK